MNTILYHKGFKSFYNFLIALALFSPDVCKSCACDLIHVGYMYTAKKDKLQTNNCYRCTLFPKYISFSQETQLDLYINNLN